MVDPIYQFPFDERSWMAPAYGMWYKTDGAEGEEPTAEFKAIMDLYNEYKVTTDPAKQIEIGKQIVKNATEQLWTIGTVGLVPTPVVVKNNFMNVHENHTADWIIMTPARKVFTLLLRRRRPISRNRPFNMDRVLTSTRSSGGIPMLAYIIRRILTMIPMLVAISFISFVIIQLPPGDYLNTLQRSREQVAVG